MATRAREGGGGGSEAKKAAPPKPSPPSTKPLPNYLRPTISSTLSSRRTNSLDLSSSSFSNRQQRDKPPSPASARLRPRSSAGPTRPAPPMRSFSSLNSSKSNVKGRVSSKASPANSSTSTVKKGVRSVGPRSVTSESSVEFEPHREEPVVLDLQTKDAKNERVVVVVVAKECQPATHGEEEEGRLDKEMAIKTELPEKEELLAAVTVEQRSGVENNTEIKEECSPGDCNIEIKTSLQPKKEELLGLVTKEQRVIAESNAEIKTGLQPEKEDLLRVVTEEQGITAESNREIKTGLQSEKKEHIAVVTQEQRSVAGASTIDTWIIDSSNTELKTEQLPKEKEHDAAVREEERRVEKSNTRIETEEEEKEEHLVMAQDQVKRADNSNVVEEDFVNQIIGTKVEEKHVVQTTSPPSMVKAPAKQTHPRKKETSQAYNDVIEETATKLIVENKRNKVRALAGAFETVISLQDNKSTH